VIQLKPAATVTKIRMALHYTESQKVLGISCDITPRLVSNSTSNRG